MHSLIVDHLEAVLAKPDLASDHPATQHLAQCADCREMVDAMRDHSNLFGVALAVPMTLRGTDAMEPAPGFYARVMERIEAQRPVSVWNLFFDSLFGRRLATASLAVAMLMMGYVVSTEALGFGRAPAQEATAGTLQLLPTSDFAGEVFAATPYSHTALASTAPSGDDVFMSLVTYRDR
ncbi:MAG: hypothetical protein ABI824_14975 [Acidobacteriota bacterium]